ncbi:LLM class flavin-dependent oxidoreductase [Parvibaculum sp.]|uniref:LLM class flavin-dependent oxidoreductase n=1 Tax=Parvibaculum sp. TaxID=2024848 RepID=UPI002C4F8868|nr:LLM class flavin-dependent oxidoreductase [Parvibaculum sp.]HUD53304.1 LLM class flavin-dependent oxidoreductase [Parvibaculum sp.]
MSTGKLRSGIFLAPFHPVDEDPTLAIRRDLELIEWLDKQGFEEAWIGEHHSAGYEIIASPELFIAAAAERTERIKLGTGVVSLPYHNPLMAANRIIQLDHQTRGRVMFGVGPGLLPSDAHMLGIEVAKQRDRMVEGLEVILRLFKGETVTAETEWFKLQNARLQLRPFSTPYPEVAVASSVTPSGGKLAGRHGLGMLCVAATNTAGYDALGINWEVAKKTALENGRVMDPSALRLVGPMHLAETREEARAQVRYGFDKWRFYFGSINPMGLDTKEGKDPLDAMIESGQAIVGTPDDAIAQIERLQQKIPGFGAYLMLAHNWANFENTKKSYELFARHVKPKFHAANEAREASLKWATDNAGEFIGAATAAAMQTIVKFQAEEEAKAKAAKPAAD